MVARSKDSHVQHVHETWRAKQSAQRAFDHAMRTAIADGVSYTVLARTIGKSESTVRQHAKRAGWAKPGDRRRMPGEDD